MMELLGCVINIVGRPPSIIIFASTIIFQITKQISTWIEMDIDFKKDKS